MTGGAAPGVAVGPNPESITPAAGARVSASQRFAIGRYGFQRRRFRAVPK
jgi:hypothetical protein